MHSAYSEKMNLPFANATGQIQKSNWVLHGSAAFEITIVKLTLIKEAGEQAWEEQQSCH